MSQKKSQSDTERHKVTIDGTYLKRAQEYRERFTKKDIDWEYVKQQYWVGRRVRDIAEEVGCHQNRIYQKVKQLEWTRAGATQARGLAPRKALEKTKGPLTDAQAVDEQASLSAEVLLGHRHELSRHKTTLAKLMDIFQRSVTAADLHRERLKEVYEALINDAAANRRDALRRELDMALRSLAVPEQSRTMKTLTETLRLIHEMERKAYGLESGSEEEFSYEDTLALLVRKIRGEDEDTEVVVDRRRTMKR